MSKKRLTGALSLAASAVLASASPVAASSPSVSLSVSKVRAGFGVTVQGAHFRPGAHVAIMFAYPKLGKYSYERFVGNATTNYAGSFTQRVQIPRIAACGRAMVYGQIIGSATFVGAGLTLTGCKGVKPPPKPSR